MHYALLTLNFAAAAAVKLYVLSEGGQETEKQGGILSLCFDVEPGVFP